ncbi:MAG: helix-turn-helix domain-containing protein [Clostridium sp.]|nr:helix-turn-helix domain-containing protein [Clostridium sp.]MCM1499497.1 helix-turn-helix domain-containing protein [Clostridium sp.]
MMLGEKIQRYRKSNHMTQEDLAELLCVSPQNISCWERNLYSPSTDKLDSIAKVLHVTVGQLMDQDSADKSQWELRDQMFSVDNLYEHTRSHIVGYHLEQSKRALPLMMRLHDQQMRYGNVPYVTHPLMMALHAFALAITEDEVIASILLHGVWKNCGIKPEDLGISLNSRVLNTLCVLHRDTGTDEREAKRKFYDRLAENPDAAIVKLIDQCNKISTIAIGLPKEKVGAYIEDIETYTLTLLNTVEKMYLDYHAPVFALKYQILSMIESLKRTL